MTVTFSVRTWVMLALLVPILLGSCSRTDPGRAAVRGAVTMDDVPLAQGSILFIPIDGNPGVATGGPIVEGKYELEGDAAPTPGWSRVEIRSLRKSGRQVPKPMAPPGEMVEADEEAVAAQFNEASTLKVELAPGMNEQSFAVTSRK